MGYRHDRISDLVREAKKVVEKKSRDIASVDLVIDNRKEYYKSRNMALEHALGGPQGAAPEVFETEFDAAHLIQDTSEHRQLIENIDRLATQFAHGRDLPNAAAQLLYAHFSKVDKAHAFEGMKNYLRLCQGGVSIKEAMQQALGKKGKTPEGKALIDMDRLASLTKDTLSTTVVADEHISYMQKLRIVVEGGDRLWIGYKMGLAADALDGPKPVNMKTVITSQQAPSIH